MRIKANPDAIEFLKMNAELFSKESAVLDSLGDASLAVGDNENAERAFKK